MKFYLRLASVMFFVFTCFVGFAVAQELDPVQTGEWLDYLKGLTNATQAGALGIALVVVQGLMLVLRSTLIKMNGALRYTIFLGLSFLAGAISLAVTGASIPEIISNTAVFTALQNFIHQLFKQFMTDKGQD